MSYLDKYDKKVYDRCCNLTPSQQLRTGFRTMGDVKRAVAVVHNPSNREHFGRVLFTHTQEQHIESILKGSSSLLTPSGIRYSVLDSGDDQAIRPAAEDNFGDSIFSSTDAGSSVSDAPQQITPELINFAIQEQLQLFNRGEIDQRELNDNIRQIREYMPIAEPQLDLQEEPPAVISGSGGARRGAGRPSREEQDIRYDEGVGIADQRAVRDTVDDMLNELEAEEYEPPTRRRMGFAEEDETVNPNRGSGSGTPNPNAPSYSAGGSGRGTSRGAGRNDFDREFDTPP